MAIPKNRKGCCADEAARDNRSPKQLRADEADQGDKTAERKRPPDDETPRAAKKIRELDRRNNARPPSRFTRLDALHKDLARFARHGGPDISHLRGYPGPKSAARTMASSRPSGSSSQQTRSAHTAATSVSAKSRKSSAYDKLFETHLIDHGVYPEGYDHPDGRSTPEPDNLDDIRLLLLANRSSLSPSRFPDSEFRRFKEKNRRAVFENDVINSVVPFICGDTDIPNQQNVLFTELDPLTTDDVVRPKPDFFDGAQLRDIHQSVKDMDDKQNLCSSIIPTKHPSVRVAPNFFLEAKGPDGSAAVVQRQACYGGAYGARAMHRLQNYGREQVAYDGNACTFSSTYHDGQLKLYAHHMTAPKAPGDRPEYHMTQVDSWGMTGNINTFRSGATAFRNARDLAKRHRDAFIQDANARASQLQAVTAQNPVVTTCDDSDTEPVDCTDYVAAQDTDDALQRHIADSTHYNSEDGETSVIPHYLFAEDDSQEPCAKSVTPGLNEPSMSFQSSFTSSLTSGPKRPRPSFSPPSISKRTDLPSYESDAYQYGREIQRITYMGTVAVRFK